MSPTKIATAVRMVLLAVAAFGVGLSGAQVAAVAIAVEAVAELFVARRVTPNSQIEWLEDDLVDAVSYGFQPPTLETPED